MHSFPLKLTRAPGGTTLTWGRSSLICRKLFVANPWDILSIQTTWRICMWWCLKDTKFLPLVPGGGGGWWGLEVPFLATMDPYPGLRMIPTKFSWNLIISFEEEDQNKHFPGSPLPQHITPNRAPMGPPTKMPWTTFILHLERYLHTTCMYIPGPSYFWILRRRCLKFT